MKPNKLNPEQRREIQQRVAAGEKQLKLAEEFGVSKQAINQLILRPTSGVRGRPKMVSLSEAQWRELCAIVTTQSPSEAGLDAKHTGWSLPAGKALVRKLFNVHTHTHKLYTALKSWGVAHFPQDTTPLDFDQDYYDYINSDIGREVRRRELEFKARQTPIHHQPYDHEESLALRAMQKEIEEIRKNMAHPPAFPPPMKKRGPNFQPKKKRRRR
jgi:transposase